MNCVCIPHSGLPIEWQDRNGQGYCINCITSACERCECTLTDEMLDYALKTDLYLCSDCAYLLVK